MIIRKSILFSMLAVFVVAVFATTAQKNKAVPYYTIMIYMNGSDLESDFGLATGDLAEMLDSGLDAKNANVLLLTGGTNRWINGAIPELECVIWQLKNGELYELESLGFVNMGEPKTLSDFITFSKETFPAQKYGLIMWDHGGGSIAGFGHDENFNNSALTLNDMEKAFETAGLRDSKLEFLGFDACLMATVEMAVIAADYAEILIAAEDLEPGDGWDYHFLSIFNRNPKISGERLGKVITDTFIRFYGKNSTEILTLSVTDLSTVENVMIEMGNLMAVAEVDTEFIPLATRRADTKTFGEGSPRDNYADMVDIGDMAKKLMDMYPTESKAVLDALKKCVLYNRHNSDVDLYGLSTFYIYGGKSIGEYSLDVYYELDMNEFYTEYLHEFFDNLTQQSAPAISHRCGLWYPVEDDTYLLVGLDGGDKWPMLNNNFVPLYEIATTANTHLYAIPAILNNREVDIVVAETNNAWEIKGSRNRLEHVLQKGYDPILPGDEIAIFYEQWDFATGMNTWALGEAFVVREELQLQWAAAPDNFVLLDVCTDACGEKMVESR